LFVVGICSCNQSGKTNKNLEARIDSLEKKLADTYKPGFGEFMSNIQMHHAKLWFAGQAQNWELAGFEVHEIQESLEAVQKYQTERKESKEAGMLYPALDSVKNAIGQKNVALFKNSFVLLTNSCNNCHRTTGFGFNVVKIPDTPPLSNQSFSNNNSSKK